MAVVTRERQWNFSLRPYRSPLFNTLHVVAWLAVLAVLLVGIYLLIPHRWLGGLGEDRSVVRDVFVVNPHWTDDNNPLWLLAVVLAAWIGWLIVQVKNRQVGLRLQPFFYLVWIGYLLIYNPIHLSERLQFTSTGLSYRWGFVHYNQIASYQWEQPYTNQDQQLGNGQTYGQTYYGLLTVTLKSSFLLPHRLQWPISSYNERDVNKVLMRYAPGWGNQPPGPRVAAS